MFVFVCVCVCVCVCVGGGVGGGVEWKLGMYTRLKEMLRRL